MSRLVLIEPLALVGWLLLGLLVLLSRGASRSARVVGLLSVLAYFWFTSPLGANVMLGLLEHHPLAAASCPAPGPGSRIVVLAGGVDIDAGGPAANDMGRLHAATMRRVLAGVRLANAAPEGTLIFSGGAGGAVREADLMLSLALALGVAPSRIAVERESGDTFANAANVAATLRGTTGPAYLVTSAAHMRRAVASFRANGIEVCAHPVDPQWVRPPAHHALIPQVSALRKSTLAYHEALGLLYYWATGRL